ncbi:MAG: hypothetical protein KDI55_00230 [Anaerolineae bacterium]|nr:hypothetical protein [Anaerolineae bacterium]
MSNVISAISEAYERLPTAKAEAAVAALLADVKIARLWGLGATVIVADGFEPVYVDRDGVRRLEAALPAMEMEGGQER